MVVKQYKLWNFYKNRAKKNYASSKVFSSCLTKMTNKKLLDLFLTDFSNYNLIVFNLMYHNANKNYLKLFVFYF